MANLVGEIPLRVLLDDRECEAHTGYVYAAGGRVLTIITILPQRGLELELISTYTGATDLPTHVIHLRAGPTGNAPAVTHSQHDHDALDPSSSPRACAYDHSQELIDALSTLGHQARLSLDDQTFAALERVE